MDELSKYIISWAETCGGFLFLSVTLNFILIALAAYFKGTLDAKK
jgi:hypothetical protein